MEQSHARNTGSSGYSKALNGIVGQEKAIVLEPR
jgi:hypothetical protein